MKTYTAEMSKCPSEDDRMIRHLSTPWWISLLILFIVLSIIIPFFFAGYIFTYLSGLAFLVVLIMLNVLCLYIHEHSHGWVLKTLLNDNPEIHLLRCIPNRSVPMPVFLIDLIAPIWIIAALGLMNIYLYIFFSHSPLIWVGMFTLVFQFVGMSSDLYWLALLIKAPVDWYVNYEHDKFVVYEPVNTK
ncbi:MAG: hypothetical protein ACOX6I_10300 [Syntrophomonadaceae bacterium]|jgi:hypothetical protein